MNSAAKKLPFACAAVKTALEDENFPIAELSEIAQQESWRKEINRPLYHIHKWWATRLGSVFRALGIAALSSSGTDIWKSFYKLHNLCDKVVLDPFMGSGTTLGEAIKLGAKAVGCDINPISTFLVQQALTSVPEESLRIAFKRLETEVASEIRRYYQTKDPTTGEPIPVLYYFWVKIVTTPEGERIPLFDRLVFAQDAYPKRKPIAQIVCPKCFRIVEGRYDATGITCFGCGTQFDPQRGPVAGQFVTDSRGVRHRIKDLLPKDGTSPDHRLYALLARKPDGEKIYLAASDSDFALFDEAERRLGTEELPLPTMHVRPGHNTDQARGYNYLTWRSFFNSRQLLCLGLLLKAILRIDNRVIREQFLCLFSSVLEFNNMFCSFKGEGTGAVRHMFSNHILKPERTPLENSVWGTDKGSGTFCSLFESRLIRAKHYLNEPFELCVEYDLLGQRRGAHKTISSSPIRISLAHSWDELASQERGALVLNGDSSSLPLPSNSVDAVITDPPYFDFVHYSELSDFFFAWLAPVLKEEYEWFSRSDSSHAGEVQQKKPREFSKQLASVLRESCRVLKDDGILAFSFHHSRAEGWAAIYEAIKIAGLCVVAAHPVHAELKGASPKSAAKHPITLDAILVCRKLAQVSRVAVLRAIQNEGYARRLVQQFKNARFELSLGDLFVIEASQLLIALGPTCTSYEMVEERLRRLHEKIFSDSASPS